MKKAAYLIVFALFVAIYSITRPDHIGDTLRYAIEIVGHARGRAAQFWEFGHLLWRPWGYLGFLSAGNWYQSAFGDTPIQAVMRFLIHTSFVFSAGITLLLLFLLRKITGNWIAIAVVAAMNLATAFIDHSHGGAPYIGGVFFSLLAVCLLATAAEREAASRWYAVAAGVAFAVCCALWFPFSVTGLGMVAVGYLWPSKAGGNRTKLVAAFLLALSVSTVVLFAGGAMKKGIANGAEFRQWVLESDNGWSQSKTAMRAVTGVPRAFWDFSSDTILLKRKLFGDPYNPPAMGPLVFRMGGKLGTFYLAIAAMLWALWRERRDVLVIFLAAAVPMLLFSIFLFEPSSTERFLPLYPFYFLAFAAVLDKARQQKAAAACVAVFLCGMAVFNLAHNSGSSADERIAAVKERMDALNHGVKPGALVFFSTLYDEVYTLPKVFPLDRRLPEATFLVTDVVEIASVRMLQWRREFATRSREQWAANQEVWLSERVLAPRPRAEWLWVEGDDKRIRWPELPETFSQYEFDSKILPGRDGFVRLADTPANRARLEKELAAK